MTDPTPTAESKNGAEQGVAHTTFAVWMLGIVLLILMAAAYVVINDRLETQSDKITGQDTWRMAEFRRQRDDAKAICEQNNTTLQILQTWAQQQPAKPPPIGMVIKVCPNFESIETKKE